jgi:hypothetical protein
MVQTMLNMAQGTSNRQKSLDLLVDQIRPMIEAYKKDFWATAQVALQTLREHKEAWAAMGGMAGGYGRELAPPGQRGPALARSGSKRFDDQKENRSYNY